MDSKEIIKKWVDSFNRADADAIADLYADDAVNHQVVTDPVKGKAAIRQMFHNEFSRAKMICIIENIFQDDEWVIVEWKDPLGLRGCGFFHVKNIKIIFQRGYWDRLSYLRQHNLPIPNE